MNTKILLLGETEVMNCCADTRHVTSYELSIIKEIYVYCNQIIVIIAVLPNECTYTVYVLLTMI